MDTLLPPENAVELSVFWTWMNDNSICRTKTKPQAEINLKEAHENTAVVTSFYRDKKLPLLVDARNVKSMAPEARKHFSTNERDTKINHFAVMVKSPFSRVIGKINISEYIHNSTGFCTPNEDYELSLKEDNGIGLPENFNVGKDAHPGIQLIFMLSEQINGTIRINHEQGTSYHITFPKKCNNTRY